MVDGDAGELEVLDAAQSLDAVVGVGWNFLVAEQDRNGITFVEDDDCMALIESIDSAVRKLS